MGSIPNAAITSYCGRDAGDARLSNWFTFVQYIVGTGVGLCGAVVWGEMQGDERLYRKDVLGSLARCGEVRRMERSAGLREGVLVSVAVLCGVR